MIGEIARKLDAFVIAHNLEARAEGWRVLGPCKIRLLGQTALLESNVPLTLTATNDVDVYADYEFAVEQEFRRLLSAQGLELDPSGHELWMPEETTYDALFAGHFVHLSVADVDSILLSKALKAPRKNEPLVIEYLTRGASARFSKLAKKYRLDLEQFL